jgi:hypothetical protein
MLRLTQQGLKSHNKKAMEHISLLITLRIIYPMNDSQADEERTQTISTNQLGYCCAQTKRFFPSSLCCVFSLFLFLFNEVLMLFT